MLPLLCPPSAVPLMESSSQESSSNTGVNKVRIGTAGWSYKDWEGIFYPPDLRHRRIHPLEYLARFFDTAEINTSFYGPLKPEHVKLWCRRVAAANPEFLFTAKLYRAFTHSPNSVLEPTSAASIRPTDEDEVLTREGLDASGFVRYVSLLATSRISSVTTSFAFSDKRRYRQRLVAFRLRPQFVSARRSTAKAETLPHLSPASYLPAPSADFGSESAHHPPAASRLPKLVPSPFRPAPPSSVPVAAGCAAEAPLHGLPAAKQRARRSRLLRNRVVASRKSSQEGTQPLVPI